MSGDRFFYANPLASFGQHERSPWFSCACCPPNIVRFIPQLGQYVYAISDGRLYINLFARSQGQVKLDGLKVELEQETDYPWKGEIRIKVSPAREDDFTIMLRIPGWALGQPIPGDLYRYANRKEASLVVKVNGEEVALNLEKGFLPIVRKWRAGDTIELTCPWNRVQSWPTKKLKTMPGWWLSKEVLWSIAPSGRITVAG